MRTNLKEKKEEDIELLEKETNKEIVLNKYLKRKLELYK